MEKLLKKYQALSQECRLRVIHILITANTPLCTCEFMDIMDKPQYKISRCLSVLKEAGLVKDVREGRLLMYSTNWSEPMNKALFDSVKAMEIKENAMLADDIRKLHQRLELRENGRVVVTYRK